MVGSTLPIWMAILLAGTVIIVMVGYCNYYVPKDQKAKAEYFRNHPEVDGQDSSIYFGKRVDEIVYLVIAVVIVILTSIFFFLDAYPVIVKRIPDFGFLGIIISAFGYLLVFFATVLFLFMLAVASESEAMKGIQKYYWGHYQVPVLDASKIEPFLRKYPR
ncbi:hypothetical protein IJG12_00355 [Candidatus Saccharibacteria bacterium]|nr:hypothetical protein [Candidatus Saccharibacteria bacterium]